MLVLPIVHYAYFLPLAAGVSTGVLLPTDDRKVTFRLVRVDDQWQRYECLTAIAATGYERDCSTPPFSVTWKHIPPEIEDWMHNFVTVMLIGRQWGQAFRT